MSVSRNTIWNLLGTAVPMAIGLFSVPYIHTHIGTERLGMLTITWALIGYFNVFDFGLGRALTQKVASFASKKQKEELEQVSSSGIKLTLLIGIVGTIIVALAFKIVGIEWLNASSVYNEEINTSFLLVSVAIPLTTATTGLRGILEGLHLFKAVSLFKFALGVGSFLGPVASIALFGPRLDAIICSLMLVRAMVLVIHLAETNRHVRLSLISLRIEKAGDLLKFGSWMTLSNLLSPLLVLADRFFISSIVGASAVAYYSVPSDFLVRILVLPAALTTTLFPVLSQELQKNKNRAFSVYNKGRKVITALMLPLTIVIALGSEFGLEIWLGPEFAQQSHLVASILAIGILFNSLAQLPHAIIQASGDAKTTALLHFAEVLVYIPLLLLALHTLGITGAAIAWTCRTGIDLVCLNFFAAKLGKQSA